MSLHKIRIVEKGWETFTGPFGSVDFVQGLSTRAVTEYEIGRIASSVHVVNEDDGLQVGEQVNLINSTTIHAPTSAQLQNATPEQFAALNAAPAPAAAAPGAEAGPKAYTGEELLAIADEKGINGLREIGNERGVKGRAIPELITNILKHQDDNGIGKPALAA